jgi:hypothetical protein
MIVKLGTLVTIVLAVDAPAYAYATHLSSLSLPHKRITQLKPRANMSALSVGQGYSAPWNCIDPLP